MCQICPKYNQATSNGGDDGVDPFHFQEDCPFLKEESNEYLDLCYRCLMPRSVHPKGKSDGWGKDCPHLLSRYLHYYCLSFFFVLYESSLELQARSITSDHPTLIPSHFYACPPWRSQFKNWASWLLVLRPGSPFSNASLLFAYIFTYQDGRRNPLPIPPLSPLQHECT